MAQGRRRDALTRDRIDGRGSKDSNRSIAETGAPSSRSGSKQGDFLSALSDDSQTFDLPVLKGLQERRRNP